MSDKKAVVKKQSGIIDWWANKEKVRQNFGKNLTPMEFDLFLAYGKAHDANPWIGEVSPVPFEGRYGRTIAFILSRDYRVRKASEQPDYDGHRAACVYEHDAFNFDGEKITHDPPSMKKKDRGELIGAFCIAWKKGISHPFFIFRYFEEYAWRTKDGKKCPKSNFWTDSPDTMMEKVAEAQLLKKCWPNIFKSTYDASELPPVNERGVIDADFEEVTSQKREFIPPEEMQQQEPPPEAEPAKEPNGTGTLFDKKQSKKKPGQHLYDLVSELYEEIAEQKGQQAEAWLKDNGFPEKNKVTSREQYQELLEKWKERPE